MGSRDLPALPLKELKRADFMIHFELWSNVDVGFESVWKEAIQQESNVLNKNKIRLTGGVKPHWGVE